MKRFLATVAVLAVTLGVSSAVFANICAFDPVPAATLLFPFVQLDFNSPVSGDTTLFSITNVSDDAQIVHVTLWTDFSFAILDFNVVLSGYDLQTMNIRDILVYGDLPNTGTSVKSKGLDYDFTKLINPVDGDADLLGPHEDGPVSVDGLGWDPVNLPPGIGTDIFNVAGICATTDESYPNYPIIPDSTLAVFQFYLTYVQYLGDAGALYHTDDCSAWYGSTDPANAYTVTPDDWWQGRNTAQPSWMYITADVVDTCNKLFPTSRSYWAPAVVNYDNVLIGDQQWINTEARFSEMDQAVHIEATEPPMYPTSVIHSFYLDAPRTFYHEAPVASTAWSGANDRREPLPTAWAFRYIGADDPAIDTHLRVWKNNTELADVEDIAGDFYGWAAVDCFAYTYYAWDEDENFLTVSQDPWSAPVGGVYIPNLLPLETQEVEVDQFNLPDTNGWMMFIWPDSNEIIAGTHLYPYQTWMGVKYSAFGQFSAAMTGAVIANANCYADQVLPLLGTNYANWGMMGE